MKNVRQFVSSVAGNFTLSRGLSEERIWCWTLKPSSKLVRNKDIIPYPTNDCF